VAASAYCRLLVERGSKEFRTSKEGGDTAKKVRKRLVLLPNVNRIGWRVRKLLRDLRTISLNDVESGESRNSMIVGDFRINFNLRLVRQLTPTIDRGMGVGETGANAGASDGTARHPRSSPGRI
jgi:hypothetical protein